MQHSKTKHVHLLQEIQAFFIAIFTARASYYQKQHDELKE